jgi:polyvinyl alcohol dehydrogenase (cytochrome)
MRSLVHARWPAPAPIAASNRAGMMAAALSIAVAAHSARALAEPPAGGGPEHVLCTDPAGPVALGSAQWNGWGRGIENTRYQPEPAIRATDVAKLALRWAFGYPGSSMSGQPTIADGRVFVASGSGRVYALDARTGCTYWSFDAQAGVSTAISIAEFGAARVLAPKNAPRSKKSRRHQSNTNAHLEVQKPPSAAFFGDDKGAVYAVDAEKGTLLWKTQIDAHPLARIQASPTLYLDRLYVAVGSSEVEAASDPGYACCTFRGSLASLEIATGRIVWKTYLVADEPRPIAGGGPGAQQFGPAGVAIDAAPTIDAGRSLVYVTTGDSQQPSAQPTADAVVAVDLIDGKVRWAKQLLDADGDQSGFTASPILRSLAGAKQVILAGQKSGIVYALDPDRAGEILWQIKASHTASAIDWGAAADHHSLYVALSGVDAKPAGSAGSLAAIEIKSGAKRWEAAAPTPACTWGSGPACPHAQAQAVTVIPGAAFSGSMDGHLRAYSTIDGKVLWDYDTAKDFTTVNRVAASGGSLDHGGATIVNGVVYVNSGGGAAHPGNVLLAFSVDGK